MLRILVEGDGGGLRGRIAQRRWAARDMRRPATTIPAPITTETKKLIPGMCDPSGALPGEASVDDGHPPRRTLEKDPASAGVVHSYTSAAAGVEEAQTVPEASEIPTRVLAIAKRPARRSFSMAALWDSAEADGCGGEPGCRIMLHPGTGDLARSS